MTFKSSNLTRREQQEYVKYYKNTYKRMNFNGGYYSTIFMNAVKQYKAKQKETEEFYETSKKNGMTALEWYLKNSEIELEKKHNEFVAITFAAMFLECIIWDYAAVNTSQNFAEDALGNMNLLNKWKVVPKLVNNNKKISIDDKTIALLKKLIAERNNIIHSKSKPVPDTYEKIKEQEKKERRITIPEIVECVKRCIEGLQKIDTTNHWFFEEEVKNTAKFPTYRTNRKGTTILTSYL